MLKSSNTNEYLNDQRSICKDNPKEKVRNKIYHQGATLKRGRLSLGKQDHTPQNEANRLHPRSHSRAVLEARNCPKEEEREKISKETRDTSYIEKAQRQDKVNCVQQMVFDSSQY